MGEKEKVEERERGQCILEGKEELKIESRGGGKRAGKTEQEEREDRREKGERGVR